MMELNLNGTAFALDTQTRETAFFVWDDLEEGLSYGLDCTFKPNSFEEERVTPALSINTVETSAKRLEDLVGTTFEVNDIKEADAREDTFYIFEHEPIEHYQLAILEMKDGRIHISCSGTAVNDGYAQPYTTATFEIDCWLPIITDVSDWEKLGL